MSEEPKPGLLDRLVEGLAALMNAVGLNGRRLLWRWEIRKREMAEGRAQAGNVLRGAKTQHRMCPECRTLVPREASHCTDCGHPMAGVSRPGAGRLLANLLPGTGSTTSRIVLVLGGLFLLTLMYGIKVGGSSGLLTGSGPALVRFGMAIGFELWWRLGTAVFLHAGIIHFGFNTLALIRLGTLVEREIGGERLWVLFIVSGIAGNVLHFALQPESRLVGASGAVFGLVGAIFMFGRRLGRAGSFYRNLIAQNALPLIIINVLPFVSWQAHLGGFLAGMGLGAVLPLGSRAGDHRGPWQAASLAAVGLVLYCFYRVAVESFWR